MVAGWRKLRRRFRLFRMFCCFPQILLAAGHVPGVGSRRRLREATAMVNQMRRQYPDLVILPAHDPGAAARLAQATASVTHPRATRQSQ